MTGSSQAVQPCSAAQKPCANIGMAATKLVDGFAKAMDGIADKWANLTEADRLAELQRAVDEVAAAAGFPSPRVVSDGTMQERRNGELRFVDWSVAINQRLLSQTVMTPDAIKQLGDTLFHETRHAEQWWLIARRDAAEGLSAKDSAVKRHIDPITASKAAKDPLPATGPQRACADSMYESVYGSGRAHRNSVLTDLKNFPGKIATATAEYDAQAKAYRAMYNDPKILNADKLTAYNEVNKKMSEIQKLKSEYAKCYADYRALPEEADAWEAGTRAGTSIGATINAKPSKVK